MYIEDKYCNRRPLNEPWWAWEYDTIDICKDLTKRINHNCRIGVIDDNIAKAINQHLDAIMNLAAYKSETEPEEDGGEEDDEDYEVYWI